MGMVRIGCAVALAAMGCATADYIYAPTQQATASEGGRPAARYPIPPERPTGDVLLTSYGVSEVQPNPGGPKSRVLLVRMVVVNNSDEAPFTIDTREQFALVAGPARTPPQFVN